MGKIKKDGLDDGTRLMRIQEKPVEAGEPVIVDDRLETEGTLRLYECAGRPVYLDPPLTGNMAEIARISIVKTNGTEVRLSQVFCEYGHEGLVLELVGQARHFAEFYGYSFSDCGKGACPDALEER